MIDQCFAFPTQQYLEMFTGNFPSKFQKCICFKHYKKCNIYQGWQCNCWHTQLLTANLYTDVLCLHFTHIWWTTFFLLIKKILLLYRSSNKMASHRELNVTGKSVIILFQLFVRQGLLNFCYLNPLLPEKVSHYSRSIDI